jgi:hypothetical protein
MTWTGGLVSDDGGGGGQLAARARTNRGYPVGESKSVPSVVASVVEETGQLWRDGLAIINNFLPKGLSNFDRFLAARLFDPGGTGTAPGAAGHC